MLDKQEMCYVQDTVNDNCTFGQKESTRYVCMMVHRAFQRSVFESE